MACSARATSQRKQATDRSNVQKPDETEIYVPSHYVTTLKAKWISDYGYLPQSAIASSLTAALADDVRHGSNGSGKRRLLLLCRLLLLHCDAERTALTLYGGLSHHRTLARWETLFCRALVHAHTVVALPSLLRCLDASIQQHVCEESEIPQQDNCIVASLSILGPVTTVYHVVNWRVAPSCADHAARF